MSRTARTNFSNHASLRSPIASACPRPRADVERMRVQQRHGAPDDAVLLQLLDAPPARGLGQADAIGDLGGAQLAVTLQQLQDSGIQLVHETRCVIPPETRNIVAQPAQVCQTNATA